MPARGSAVNPWTIRTSYSPSCADCGIIIAHAPSCRRRTPLGEQLLTLAQQVQDPAMLVAAHRAVGLTLSYLGAVVAAHTH